MKQTMHILKSYSDEADLTLCGLKLFSFDGALPAAWTHVISKMFKRRKVCAMCKKRIEEG